jgi:hypothetical protein
VFSAIGRLLSGFWRWFTGLFAFRPPEHERRGAIHSTARVTWRAGTILFILGFLAWNIDFVWATLFTRNYSLAYPKQILQPAAVAVQPAAPVAPAAPAAEPQPGQLPAADPQAPVAPATQPEPAPAAPAAPASGEGTTGTLDVQSETANAAMLAQAQAAAPGTPTGEAGRCQPSKLVEMQAYLIDFLVNQNRWTPSMPQYKAGVLGIWAWEETPFFDNKAAFQLGVLSALRRTGVELTDILGRTRGTSAADSDLQSAQSALQTDERTWYFNPFDRQRPFGPTTASPTYYRQAMRNYVAFNERLEKCQATFDARADNLLQFLERVAADVGSTIDILGKRSQGERYDPRTDEFVPGEGNDRGWFDFRADDLFMFASGKMYAYHGLLQAARADFAGVIQRRDIGAVWDLMEEHVAEAAALQPLIVSNGREDGALMPDHLAVLSQKMLRARANMSEIRDILNR